MPIDKLSKYRDDIGADVFQSARMCGSGEIVFVENVEMVDAFRGFGLEICLVRRIIDSHARSNNAIMVEISDSTKAICERMKSFAMSLIPFGLCPRASLALNPNSLFKCCSVHSIVHNTNDLEDLLGGQQLTEILRKNYYIADEPSSVMNGSRNNEGNSSDTDTKIKCQDISLSRCFISFSSTQNGANNIPEDDYIDSWGAELEHRPSEGQKPVKLATARFWYIQMERLQESNADLFWVFDARDQALTDLMAVVILHSRYDDDSAFFQMREGDEKRWDLNRTKGMNEGGGGNAVYLDDVKVEKGYEGRMFGRCLVQRIIDNFARELDAVVLKPFPLQWDMQRGASDADNRQNKKQYDEDIKAVVKVWESMGFKQFGEDDSQYWGRSESLPNPRILIENDQIKLVAAQ